MHLSVGEQCAICCTFELSAYIFFVSALKCQDLELGVTVHACVHTYMRRFNQCTCADKRETKNPASLESWVAWTCLTTWVLREVVLIQVWPQFRVHCIDKAAVVSAVIIIIWTVLHNYPHAQDPMQCNPGMRPWLFNRGKTISGGPNIMHKPIPNHQIITGITKKKHVQLQ